MKMNALVAFRSKLFRPFFVIFRFKLKRPVFIRVIWLHPRQKKSRKTTVPKKRVFPSLSLFSVLRPFKRLRKMDRLRELRGSVYGEERERMLFPSPITPAYQKDSGDTNDEPFGSKAVEDACRSFENYLIEMMIEEGKVTDLMDVEELLYCWRNLKCPVFIDLVSRFYGELCKDLFLPEDDLSDTASPK